MRIADRVHGLKIPFTIPVGPGLTVPRYVYVHANPLVARSLQAHLAVRDTDELNELISF